MLFHDQISVVANVGSSVLASSIADLLNARVLFVCESYFDNGELNLSFGSDLSHQDVIVVQTFTLVNSDLLMAFFILMDAIFHSNPRRVRLVIPYLPYSRSDRSVGHSQVISIRAVAGLLKGFDLQGIYTVDLHSTAALDFFDGGLHQLYAAPLWANCFYRGEIDYVVSPDQGGQDRASRVADLLACDVITMCKTRLSNQSVSCQFSLDGLPQGHVVIVDDVMSSGSTVFSCAEILLASGFKVSVCVTHVFAEIDALMSLVKIGVDKVIVTDTVARKDLPGFVEVLTVAPLLAHSLVQ